MQVDPQKIWDDAHRRLEHLAKVMESKDVLLANDIVRAQATLSDIQRKLDTAWRKMTR